MTRKETLAASICENYAKDPETASEITQGNTTTMTENGCPHRPSNGYFTVVIQRILPCLLTRGTNTIQHDATVHHTWKGMGSDKS